jgi:choline dehydrogenase-like flavoprotein
MVDLDPTIRDAWGRPAGRVTYNPHLHELVTSKHYAPILEDVLKEAGASWAFSVTSPPTTKDVEQAKREGLGIAPASYHVMGTARMGTDPATSVVDPSGRFWDLPNVICADSSVFATASGYNPTLTICALAHRAASLLIDQPLAPTTPYRTT